MAVPLTSFQPSQGRDGQFYVPLSAVFPAHGSARKLRRVGTGVGWLAIEAARSWPALRIVGIDSWAPALTLARKNLAQSSVAERVELRSQRIEHLDDEKIFTLVWLPGPFIAAEIVAVGLDARSPSPRTARLAHIRASYTGAKCTR